MWCGLLRGGAADINDAAAAGFNHPFTDQGHEPIRAFEVDTDDLVEEFLGDITDFLVQR